MTDKPTMRLTYDSAVSEIHPWNSSFDKAVMYACYTGRNRNGSYISKEDFEKCMQTRLNCPIVCHYMRDEDEIGAHDVEIARDENGSARFVNLTEPVGVVPESSRYWWAEMEDKSGTHEYLCMDIVLWKRQEAYRYIKEHGIVKESMEINVGSGHKADGIFHITDFEFTGFCLLGEGVEPCFEGAAVQLFSAQEMQEQMSAMMQDFKESFALIHESDKDVYIDNNEQKGGEAFLKDETEIVTEEPVVTPESEEQPAGETAEEPADVPEEAPEEQFALTGEQLRNELEKAVMRCEEVEDDWGKMPRYFYVDYDPAAEEVYFMDALDECRLYGCGYRMDGDRVVLDMENKKRKKIAIVDFDEGEEAVQTAVFAGMRETLRQYANAAIEANANSVLGELTELREFRKTAEAAERREQEDAVFAEFEPTLGGCEEFANLRESCSGLSIDEIREKCYAIRGRTYAFSLNDGTATKLLISQIDRQNAANTPEPYGGLFVEYGHRK